MRHANSMYVKFAENTLTNIRKRDAVKRNSHMGKLSANTVSIQEEMEMLHPVKTCLTFQPEHKKPMTLHYMVKFIFQFMCKHAFSSTVCIFSPLSAGHGVLGQSQQR